MNMHLKIWPTTDVSFPTNTTKNIKYYSIFAAPTLQVDQSVTNIDSNGTLVPEIMTKVMIYSISGDPIYLIRGTPNQYHQENIYSLHKPSYHKIFFIYSTIRPLHTNTALKTPATTIGFGLPCHTP